MCIHSPQFHREAAARFAVQKAQQKLTDLKAADPEAFEELCRQSLEKARRYQARAMRGAA